MGRPKESTKVSSHHKAGGARRGAGAPTALQRQKRARGQRNMQNFFAAVRRPDEADEPKEDAKEGPVESEQQ